MTALAGLATGDNTELFDLHVVKWLCENLRGKRSLKCKLRGDSKGHVPLKCALAIMCSLLWSNRIFIIYKCTTAIFANLGLFYHCCPNVEVPYVTKFFSSKYRLVGCPERRHVMPGLYATFSNVRDPLRGSKRPKSQFYGRLRPQIPILGT